MTKGDAVPFVFNVLQKVLMLETRSSHHVLRQGFEVFQPLDSITTLVIFSLLGGRDNTDLSPDKQASTLHELSRTQGMLFAGMNSSVSR